MHGLGELVVSYHSETPFEVLDDRYTTECRLGMMFVTWFIVKLYWHVNLCITCHILIVSYDIHHMGIKVVSWIWVVSYVTNIPDSSDNI